MKIIGATCFSLRIPFVEAFGHSASVRARSDSVVVRLTAEDGTVGYGEGLPRPYVTGETVESCIDHIAQCLWPAIADSDFPALEPGPAAFRVLDPVGRNLPDGDAGGVVAWHAARAACELALLDVLLRRQKQSLGEILRPRRGSVTYSGVITSGSIDNAVRLARVCVEYGLQAVKIKIDGDDARERVTAVRDAVGPDVSLRVDANCAYTPDEAVATLDALAALDIACAEQPIPRGDPEALANVRSRSPIPIMADESLVTLADAEALIQAGACDFFNLRISKCGGLARTLEIARMADRAGLQLQLGCQVGESAILSAAGRHVAAHLERVSFVEGSYGNMLLVEDVTEESIAFDLGGQAPLLRGPGLGVDVRDDILRAHAETTTTLAAG
ncbi:MAG: dipeptide epimerase [Gemmatimonadota bacterium]|nr:dipeptide epimerase [Gemmatimonadota bacterium]